MKPAGKSVVSVIALALGAIAGAFAIRGHVKTTPVPGRGS
jgi:hypothetical protein